MNLDDLNFFTRCLWDNKIRLHHKNGEEISSEEKSKLLRECLYLKELEEFVNKLLDDMHINYVYKDSRGFIVFQAFDNYCFDYDYIDINGLLKDKYDLEFDHGFFGDDDSYYYAYFKKVE